MTFVDSPKNLNFEQILKLIRFKFEFASKSNYDISVLKYEDKLLELKIDFDS